MSIDEDAMLTAIGVMSMDEAREKWADQWSDFMRSLSRWKSVHQLFRLARLNSMVSKMAGMHLRMQLAVNQANAGMKEIAALAEEAGKLNKENRKDTEEVIGKAMDMILNGKIPKKDQARIESLIKMQMAEDVKVETALVKVREMKLREESDVAKAKSIQRSLRMRSMQLKDEIDITKPYAMGLLVADVFYSLSAALEGDIY